MKDDFEMKLSSDVSWQMIISDDRPSDNGPTRDKMTLM